MRSSNAYKNNRKSEQVRKPDKNFYKESDTIKSADFGRMDSELNYQGSPTNKNDPNVMVDRGSMRTVES